VNLFKLILRAESIDMGTEALRLRP